MTDLNRIRQLAGILTESVVVNEEMAQAQKVKGKWTDGTYTEGDSIAYRGLSWNLEWEAGQPLNDDGTWTEGAWYAVGDDGDEFEFHPGMEDRHDPQGPQRQAFPEDTQIKEVTGRGRPGSFTNVIDAMVSAIAKCPDFEQQTLAQAIEDFAEMFPGSYKKMMESRTLGELLSEVSEVVDARPGSAPDLE